MRRLKSEHNVEIDDNQICNLIQQLDSVKNGFQFLFEEFYLQNGKSKQHKLISEELQYLISILTAIHQEASKLEDMVWEQTEYFERSFK